MTLEEQRDYWEERYNIEKKKNEELEEYKRITELTKISCCTAQNCEALGNAIKLGLENNKLKEQLDDLIKEAYINGTNVAHELCNQMWKKKVDALAEEMDENGSMYWAKRLREL